MKQVINAAFALFLVASSAQAQGPNDAAYFCTIDAAGGVRYNNLSKHWDGARFRPDDKFVLRLKYMRHDVADASSFKLPSDYYRATVTKEGSNSAMPCMASYANRGSEDILVMSKIGLVACYASLKEYTFSLKNNRVMVAYLVGYLDGDDDRDTPAIEIGKCTKIGD